MYSAGVVCVYVGLQDRYVPFHSSSLSPCPAAERDAKRGPVYIELLRSILAGTGSGRAASHFRISTPGADSSSGTSSSSSVPIRHDAPTHLYRACVDFNLKSKGFSFSKLVGRTAHIEFIESQVYVNFLMWGLLVPYNLLAPPRQGWV